MCSQYIVAVNSKLGRTKDKESSCLWKQLLFHSDSFVARKRNVEQKVAENWDPYCTELAVTHNTYVIKKQAENGNLTGCVFTDLSKAFDTISHAGLLYKFPLYRIQRTELEWFNDYLFGRSQAVQYKSVLSELSSTSIYRCTSGKYLGRPVLFIIRFNDAVFQRWSLMPMTVI